MATDILIDPVTRDFVDTDDGAWEETEDSRTAVFCQVSAREGAWWGDPESGSRNAEILESEVPTIEELLDSTKRALRKMGAAGVISDIFAAAQNADNARGYAELYLQWRDRASNRPADLAYAPLGGKP